MVLGGGFLLLSLFAGILGGAMALPIFSEHPTAGMFVTHAVSMTLFVMCPAVLGGLVQCSLPKMVGCSHTMLRHASALGWAFLFVGVLMLPFVPAFGLALWSVGILAVAFDVIATVLEGRAQGFRFFSPLVWAFLAMSMALLIMVPVLLALLVKGVSPMSIIEQLRLPEMSLMLIPAVGIVAHRLTAELDPHQTLTMRVAPYALIAMGLIGPLLWADMLFGGVPRQFFNIIVITGQALPGLCMLLALCKDSWTHTLKHSVALSWSFGALILLVVGWVSMLVPRMLFWRFPSMMALHGMTGEFGHQAGIFGALMALSGAFYAWFAQQFSVRSVWYAFAGRLHAALTFLGAVCSFFPQWESVSIFMMTASLLGYVYLGAVAWRRVLENAVHRMPSPVVKKGS